MVTLAPIHCRSKLAVSKICSRPTRQGIVYVNACAIGRDLDYWEKPEEFLPERFMGSSVDYKGQDSELIPFGAGRRGCPGMYVGVVTVELALANLLYSFEWELPTGMKKEDIDTDVLPGITMHKKNALCLLAKKIDGYNHEFTSSNSISAFSTNHQEHTHKQEKRVVILKSATCELGETNNKEERDAIAQQRHTTIEVSLVWRYDDEDCERSKFHGLLQEAQAVLASFFVSDYFPFLGWVDKLNGMSSRADKIFKEMDLFYQEITDERMQEESSKSEQEDILDVLLQLQKVHSFTIDLTLDHIKAVLMNIFMAGTDTSAATLVWAMTGLMKHPRTMKRVQEEIRHASVERGMVKEDDLHKLPYLKAVVKETLRLHPPSPLLLPHETTKKCNINGYEIPPKTCVYVNAWAVGRDPESWEHPEEFLPERFMDSCIDYKGQDFEFIPFGAGRRGCPGIYLGALTVELALANLLNSFDWELPPGMKKEDIDMDVLPGITMHKKNALCLLAKKYHGHVYQ
ncbi:5-OH-xanthotoxin synthase-like [Cornus florida]|uniref:5-OH-xanthotoxin synthase-like n=1 Tax=Cornus florida TaxID=4283 RepID=UPI0028A0C523|nr:5-OH-xanthotoxin synthase-like [Cornus florida]